jgi:hypothetical protein
VRLDGGEGARLVHGVPPLHDREARLIVPADARRA